MGQGGGKARRKGEEGGARWKERAARESLYAIQVNVCSMLFVQVFYVI